ncbi:MAG TPA: LytTR family DNA-binding domain-containing protein [Puia sp.]
MNIRSIIIDDEPNNIENLRAILAAWCEGIEVVSIAMNATDGIAAIKMHQPDLLFLDIQLAESSGFDVLRAFPRIDFEIIFITAYDQYGIQAIKFSALDYLLKPLDIEELKQAIEKAKNKIATKQKNSNIENLLEYLAAGKKEPHKIALPTLQEIRYVKIEEIIRCEASDNYTRFFIQNGEQILVCKTLKEFAELLRPHNFIRTHQSHLVNIHFVKSFLKEDGGMLLMKDQAKIPIARQHREFVKEALNSLL